MAYPAAPPTVGVGLKPYLLPHLMEIVGTDACPELKVENLGLLNMLQAQNKPELLRLSDGQGGQRFVQIKAHQRFTPEFTSTTASCNNTDLMTYYETSVSLPGFRQLAVQIDNSLLAQYTADCYAYQTLGKPATKVMGEFVNMLNASASALMQAVNRDLWGYMVYGNNVNTGNATAKTINFTQNTTNLPLGDGLTNLLQDYQENLGFGTPQMVGSGYWHAFFMQQRAKGIAQNGLNTSIEASGCNFRYDVDSPTYGAGTNGCAVIQPDAVQLVEFMQYEGFRSTSVMNTAPSEFGTLMLPYRVSPTEIALTEFDFQFKFYDCPTTLTNQYYGTSLNVGVGYNLIISKTFGLYQIGSQAYRATDRLNGNNGVLKYTATNN